MSLRYRAIGWNRQKRTYDATLLAFVVSYLALFVGLGNWVHPHAKIETLLIRGLGTASFLLLHVILAIGPLCRLDRRFLPLLYNRRHLGVTMFLLALGHGTFSLIQFHALGDLNPLISLLVSNQRYNSLAHFPFQQLGLLALLVLFLMAATSHDFWLHNLTPGVWKRLHMGVYLAYALLLGHVTFGALQSETSTLLAGTVGAGLFLILGLHLAAAFQERRIDVSKKTVHSEGFVEVCSVEEIPEKRARIVSLQGERIALFRYAGKVSALSNVCAHQNGPLGEGKIVDGCVTCPWHGYQYRPDSGSSPPPFHEKVATFRVRIVGKKVSVCPRACEPGTLVEPAKSGLETALSSQDGFYVGYEPVAPRSIAERTRQAVMVMGGIGFIVMLLLVLGQNNFSASAFEFLQFRNFEGIAEEFPVPALRVRRPGSVKFTPDYSRYLLVGQGKHGVGKSFLGLDGRRIRLTGSLIYRDGTTMIEWLPENLQIDESTTSVSKMSVPAPENLGSVTLQGEIVDSKCFLGVMNPGQGKVHRDCAVRCISGGVPPAFRVRNGAGDELLLLLVSPDGEAIHQKVLGHVAEPLKLSGQLLRFGDTLLFKADVSMLAQ